MKHYVRLNKGVPVLGSNVFGQKPLFGEWAEMFINDCCVDFFPNYKFTNWVKLYNGKPIAWTNTNTVKGPHYVGFTYTNCCNKDNGVVKFKNDTIVVNYYNQDGLLVIDNIITGTDKSLEIIGEDGSTLETINPITENVVTTTPYSDVSKLKYTIDGVVTEVNIK